MNKKPLDVIVVGAIGIDTNVYLYDQEIDFSVEMNFSQNLDTVGQAGGYCARILSALGVNTAFAGFVGDDMGGHEIRSVLSDENIDVSALNIDPQGTKRSINFMYPDGRRKNFYDGRGSMDVTIDPSSYSSLFEGASIAHFSIVNWTRFLLPLARQCGTLKGTGEGCFLSLNELQSIEKSTIKSV